MEFDSQFVRLLMTFVGFGSVLVWAQSIRLWSTEQLQPLALRETKPVPWDQWTVLAAFGIWGLTDKFTYFALGVDADSPIFEKVQALCLAGFLKILLLIELMEVSGGRQRSPQRPKLADRWIDIKVGVWGLLASLIPVWGVSWAILPFREPDDGHPYLQAIQDGAGPQTLAWIALAVVVVAPLFEELIFRVILQGWLHKHVSPVVAVVGVAFSFAAVHFTAWPDPLPLIPLSLVFGYIYYRRRSYLANVVMHALFNGLNLIQALSAGD